MDLKSIQWRMYIMVPIGPNYIYMSLGILAAKICRQGMCGIIWKPAVIQIWKYRGTDNEDKGLGCVDQSDIKMVSFFVTYILLNQFEIFN